MAGAVSAATGQALRGHCGRVSGAPMTLELEILAKQVEALRGEMLFEDNDHEGMIAEQHYLSAVAHLELAQRALMLAHVHSMRERTGGRPR